MENVLQFYDVDALYEYLVEELEEGGDGVISTVVDYNTAVELLTSALVDEYRPFIIDIDYEEYDDAYIVTLTSFNDRLEVSVEKAHCCSGYLTASEDMLVDCSLPTFNDYMDQVKQSPFYCSDGTKYFVIGENKNVFNKTYDYHNKFEDGNRFADFSVTSNVKDFVDVLQKFFEDYF